jgi:hypothetical protein
MLLLANERKKEIAKCLLCLLDWDEHTVYVDFNGQEGSILILWSASCVEKKETNYSLSYLVTKKKKHTCSEISVSYITLNRFQQIVGHIFINIRLSISSKIWTLYVKIIYVDHYSVNLSSSKNGIRTLFN